MSSASRLEVLSSAETYFAGSEAAGAPLPHLSPALAASTIRDIFYSVRNVADGRFCIQAPDGLTIVQFYDDLDAADEAAAHLNEPIWAALKPKGLAGYDPPAPDPGDVLLGLLDKRWRYEDGSPLPPVVREPVPFGVAEWVNP